MKSFIFNNISSESLGLVIKSMPKVPRPAKNIEVLEVAGRNGNLHIDNGNYKAIEYTIECVCKDKSKIDQICSALVGTGKLILSDYSDRYWEATIMNQITFNNYLTILDSFPLQLELNPIAKSNNEITEELTQDASIEVDGNVEISPLITIEGVGTVTINGYSLEVLESGITIDCELMQCYNNSIAKNDKVILNKFPVLSVGNNNIVLGSGIDSVTIKYRKGWL